MIISQDVCASTIDYKVFCLLFWKVIPKLQSKYEAPLKYNFNRYMRTHLQSNFIALPVII